MAARVSDECSNRAELYLHNYYARDVGVEPTFEKVWNLFAYPLAIPHVAPLPAWYLSMHPIQGGRA